METTIFWVYIRVILGYMLPRELRVSGFEFSVTTI